MTSGVALRGMVPSETMHSRSDQGKIDLATDYLDGQMVRILPLVCYTLERDCGCWGHPTWGGEEQGDQRSSLNLTYSLLVSASLLTLFQYITSTYIVYMVAYSYLLCMLLVRLLMLYICPPHALCTGLGRNLSVYHSRVSAPNWGAGDGNHETSDTTVWNRTWKLKGACVAKHYITCCVPL